MELYLEKQIAKAALDTYGTLEETDKAIEECSELIQAIQRWRYGRVPPEVVEEEIADVEVVLQAMRHQFDSKSIDRFRDFKFRRLLERIQGRYPNVTVTAITVQSSRYQRFWNFWKRLFHKGS